jgi:hypothetical protein
MQKVLQLSTTQTKGKGQGNTYSKYLDTQQGVSQGNTQHKV